MFYFYNRFGEVSLLSFDDRDVWEEDEEDWEDDYDDDDDDW
ncbi:MAG: hypothetical protein ACXAAP_06545 [Candidatus Thorarchaeota archaeon]